MSFLVVFSSDDTKPALMTQKKWPKKSIFDTIKAETTKPYALHQAVNLKVSSSVLA